MRILYVTQIVPYPPHGGVLQRGFNLLRELGRRHQVRLLAFHHPDELLGEEAVQRSRAELGRFCDSLEYFELWPKRSRAHLVAGLAYAGLRGLPFASLAYRSEALSRRIRDLCHGRSPPDIVHLDTIGLAQYAPNCGSIPAVLAHHNVESMLMQRRSEFESGALSRLFVAREALKLRKLEADVAGQFRMNIMVSDADAEALREICPAARTAVVANGVDTDYFAPTAGPESPCVIFTGGMNMFANRDGVDWFLENVWPILKSKVRELRFVAIGQQPTERLVQVSRQDPDVEAPGFVADVRPAVATAAVFLVPLRVGGGTRLKVLDAMAQGKAIVSTTLGAEGINVSNGRHLLLADDAESFAARIVELLGNAALRRSLGEAAREQVVRHYAWRNLGLRLSEAYESAIAAPVH